MAMTCLPSGFRAMVVGLLALLAPVAGLDTAGAAQDPSASGSIDLETANRLLDDYARHVLSQLPRRWREAQEKKWRDDPPRFGANSIYQFSGPAGRIALEHDPEKQRLYCYAVIFKPRREYPLIGLTGEEILTALERAAAAGVDTGGGEVVYDPIAKGFFLRRGYSQPPKSARQMARQLDRLTAAGEKWFRKHYLEAVSSHARTLRPPQSATARDGDFRVTLVLTPDVRYHDLWKRPPGAIQPQLVSRSQFTRGQEVWALALFSGATAGDGGAAKLEGQYSFVYPSGEEAGSEVFMFWDDAPPPADHLQVVGPRAAIELGADKAVGDYLARVKVCDVFTKRCVTAVSPFRVLPAPG